MKLSYCVKSRLALMMLIHYDCIVTPYGGKLDEEQPPSQYKIIQDFLSLGLIKQHVHLGKPVPSQYTTTEAGNLAVKEFLAAFAWLIDGINEKVEESVH